MRPRIRYHIEGSGRSDEYHWQIRRLNDDVIVGLYHTRKRAGDVKAELESRHRPGAPS